MDGWDGWDGRGVVLLSSFTTSISLDRVGESEGETRLFLSRREEGVFASSSLENRIGRSEECLAGWADLRRFFGRGVVGSCSGDKRGDEEGICEDLRAAILQQPD